MVRKVIISPYRYKAHNKFKSLIKSMTKKSIVIEAIADEFGDNVWAALSNDSSLEIIVAIPKEIKSAIANNYFDVAYIDTDYNNDEVWEIRQHLIGQQSKPIIYF